MQQLHYVVSCPLHDKYSDPINHHCLLLWQSKFSPCITFVSIIYIICKVGAIVVVTEWEIDLQIPMQLCDKVCQ